MLKLEMVVNDEKINIEVKPNERLLDVLRDRLGLTSVKEGCAEGECGACTVLMNGRAVTSCTVFAMQAREAEIFTVEGLEKNGELDIIQSAFIQSGAIQCGFCTPGMIMSCKALLLLNPNPSDEEIKRAVEGNLCRCTGYQKIINAVQSVVREGATK